MNRDKVLEKQVLEKCILRLTKEMISIFKMEKIKLRKDKYELLKQFYQTIKYNEESKNIYENILMIYSEEIKVLDYYFEKGEILYDTLLSKYNKINDKEKFCGCYLMDNEFNLNNLELLKSIFNKTVEFEIPFSNYGIEITKCPSIEKEAIISLQKKNS